MPAEKYKFNEITFRKASPLYSKSTKIIGYYNNMDIYTLLMKQ